jgi:hypothetical protein
MRRSLIIGTHASSCYFRTSVEGDGRKALTTGGLANSRHRRSLPSRRAPDSCDEVLDVAPVDAGDGVAQVDRDDLPGGQPPDSPGRTRHLTRRIPRPGGDTRSAVMTGFIGTGQSISVYQ